MIYFERERNKFETQVTFCINANISAEINEFKRGDALYLLTQLVVSLRNQKKHIFTQMLETSLKNET